MSLWGHSLIGDRGRSLPPIEVDAIFHGTEA